MKVFTTLVAAALVAVGAFAQQNGITINSLYVFAVSASLVIKCVYGY
jgi:hypothetical protein